RRGGEHAGEVDLDVAHLGETGVLVTLDAKSAVGDEIAVGVDAEVTGASDILGVLHGVAHHEVAFARDGEVRLDVGAGHRALGIEIADRAGGDARTDLHRGRAAGVCAAGA